MSKQPPIPPEQRAFHGARRTPAALPSGKLEHPTESDTSLREPSRRDSARQAASAQPYRHQGR